MAAPSLFDFIGALRNTKENLLMDADPETEKAFKNQLFVVRRGLAQTRDSLVAAEQMNKLHSMTPWMQWCLAYFSIQKTKRYEKWAKKTEMDENVVMLANYFYISHEKASEYLRFLPKEALEEIRAKVQNCEYNEKAKPRKAK